MNLRETVPRRRFLIMVSALLFQIPGPSILSAQPLAFRRPHILGLLKAINSRALAEEFFNRFPGEKHTLESWLLDTSSKHSGGFKELRAALVDLIQADFDKQKIVQLSGWILSITEARLLGLASQFSQEEYTILDSSSFKTVSKHNVSSVKIQNTRRFADRWFDDQHLFIEVVKVPAKIKFKIQNNRKGLHEVFLILSRAPDYGIVRISFKGSLIQEFDLCSGRVQTVSRAPALDLGRHRLNDGEMILSIEVIGRSSLNTGPAAHIGIDAMLLVPH